jgi:DnaJ-class molecular chaperone
MGLRDSDGNRGDQMIIIDVSIPNNLDDLAKKTLDEIRKKHYI